MFLSPCVLQRPALKAASENLKKKITAFIKNNLRINYVLRLNFPLKAYGIIFHHCGPFFPTDPLLLNINSTPIMSSAMSPSHKIRYLAVVLAVMTNIFAVWIMSINDQFLIVTWRH